MLNREHYNLPHQGPKVALLLLEVFVSSVVMVGQYGFIMYNVFLKQARIAVRVCWN
jgi:hypothetical protein